ncbi:hypothetical protein GGI20_002562 [Coemansia sp. BCRC 34301]|nr:hypothetical protein GGI20_002562 [Coemansia sp. BCRC 34301]
MLSQILASPKLMDKAFYWAIGLALEFTSQRAVMKAVCMDMPAVAVTSNDEFIGELEKRAALYVEAFVKIVGSSSFVDMKLKAASNATAEQVTNRAAMTSTSTSASGSHSKAD